MGTLGTLALQRSRLHVAQAAPLTRSRAQRKRAPPPTWPTRTKLPAPPISRAARVTLSPSHEMLGTAEVVLVFQQRHVVRVACSTFEVTCNEKFMGGGVATCGTDGNFNDVLCAATLNGVLKQSLTFEGVSKEQIDNLEKKKRIEASIATYLKIDKESVKITSIKESASSSSGIEIKYEVSGQNSGTADNALVTTRMSAMKTATNVVSAVAEEGGVSIASVRIASVSKTTVEKAPSPSASPSASPGSSGSSKSSRISPMNIMFIILAVVV